MLLRLPAALVCPGTLSFRSRGFPSGVQGCHQRLHKGGVLGPAGDVLVYLGISLVIAELLGHRHGWISVGHNSLPTVAESQQAAAGHWQRFWTTGGAIDLSASKDPRWKELERRIVLSQYQMAAQSAGSWPSAETGLMGVDFWSSQFHWNTACGPMRAP